MFATILIIVLVCSASLVAYTYVGYPLLLRIINLINPKARLSVLDGYSCHSTMTIIITAYNEQDRIRSKIENTLALSYPEEKLEILVASDGSTDATDEIVGSYERVKLLRVEGRVGKEATQLEALRNSTGDLVVFTDVATSLTEKVLQRIDRVFGNKQIGAISSEDKFVASTGEVSGEGTYVKYEMFLRQQESEFNSLVGLSGSFFACRRVVCREWNTQIPSDFGTAINCVRNDYRAASVSDINGFYKDLADPSREYDRKVRTVLRGISGLYAEANVLNPMNNPKFAFQMLSHKVLRWLSPWFIILFFGCSLGLALGGNSLGIILTILQICVVTLALVFRGAGPPILKLGFFFLLTNAAICQATLQFAQGKRSITWQPSKR